MLLCGPLAAPPVNGRAAVFLSRSTTHTAGFPSLWVNAVPGSLNDGLRWYFDLSHERCAKTHCIRRIVESDLHGKGSCCCIRAATESVIAMTSGIRFIATSPHSIY
jgi:hypothetical protein